MIRGFWGRCFSSCSVWVVALSFEAVSSRQQLGAAASPSLWKGRGLDSYVGQALKLITQVLWNGVAFLNLTVARLGLFDTGVVL